MNQYKNSLSVKLGFWSAILSLFLFLLFTFCFIGIAITSKLFIWTNITEYIKYNNENPQLLKYIAQASMLLFGPLYIILINSIKDLTGNHRKPLASASLLFAVIFAVLTGIHYFIQLTTVRYNLTNNQIIGLEHFIQSNPDSFILAVNMLGWTLFLGLSALFIMPVFSGKGINKVIRYSFLITALSCLLGGIGFLFKINILTFFTINLGMGGAIITATTALTIFFFRLLK
jgi:hypothetical protein